MKTSKESDAYWFLNIGQRDTGVQTGVNQDLPGSGTSDVCFDLSDPLGPAQLDDASETGLRSTG